MDVLSPRSVAEVVDAVSAAAARGGKLEIRGGGGKAAFGAPSQAAALDMRAISGVIDYDPAELVLSVRAGTPLGEVQALVAGEEQMLAFDPWDASPLFGAVAAGTIGGAVAAAIAGPGRLSGGAVRDHVLGFKAVSGRGEAFAAGSKVVKNVTGYDLSKLMTGSWGRLAVLTEINLKVLPRPQASASVALVGLDDAAAIKAMSAALGSPAEVAAAAHMPPAVMGGEARTILRLQGVAPSVEARCAHLLTLLAAYGHVSRMDAEEAQAAWQCVREVAPLSGEPVLWRVILPPSRAAHFSARLAELGARWLFDWGGNLAWVASEAAPEAVRAAAERAGGHAALIRAPSPLRERVPALHPRPKAVAALEARIRCAFDPAGVFETGRFLDNSHAD